MAAGPLRPRSVNVGRLVLTTVVLCGASAQALSYGNVTLTPTQNVTNTSAPTASNTDEAAEGRLMTGVAFAFFGNLGIAASLCVQKKAHNIIIENGDKIRFFQSPMWWAGMVVNIIGEVGNLLAYGFAPASVVAPVGAVGVVGNCFFAWYFLHELFGFRGIVGSGIVMGGVILVVLGAPEEPHLEMDVNRFYDFVVKPIPIAYFCVACVSGIVIYTFSRKHGRASVHFYTLLAADIGSFTVIAAKAVSTFIATGFLHNAGTITFWVSVLSLATRHIAPGLGFR